MNTVKFRFLLLAASVLGMGAILGTVLWMKFAPRPQHGGWNERVLESLSHYGTVPPFSLVERSGKSASLADLRGMIWVADFIYTRCTDTCPLQTREMAKLQQQWKDKGGVKLVSFSVDPEKDTPKILSSYADRFGADADRWLFLTGGKQQVMTLVQEGFRLSASPAPDRGDESAILLHSPRFVLVDKEAHIRGYYDSRDPEAVERLRKDISTLLHQ